MILAGQTSINSVSELKYKNELKIFPNPTNRFLMIQLPSELKNSKDLSVKIYDFTGKFVKNPKIEIFDDKVKIDLNNEAKGIYNVVLSNGVKSYGGKIVFE